MNKQKIGIVVLAAGASARMNGEAKQLLKFGGKTLLRRAAQTALDSACQPVIVVLGANAAMMRKEIEDLHVSIVVNKDWASGMSASIKSGLSALLEENENLVGVIIMLCDQPFVTPQTLNRLIEIYQKTNKPIVACKYEDTAGVPALFAREKFGDLLNLQGDAGAKAVINKIQETSVETILAPEAEFDVDTQHDFKQLQASDESAIRNS